MPVLHGDCLDVMGEMAPESIDSIVTDPPYALTGASRNNSPRVEGTGPFGRHTIGQKGFMGKAWDGQIPGPDVWAAALRVARPGAYLLAFGGTRTYHRLACAIEDAGWEIRDCLCWMYGSGFPKNKACLKPAWEPIILARKPGRSAHLQIDACRIETDDNLNGGAYCGGERPTSAMGCDGEAGGKGSMLERGSTRLTPEQFEQPVGRWPANVLLDEEAAAQLDAQAGECGAFAPVTGDEPSGGGGVVAFGKYGRQAGAYYADSGGPSRFFYCAKASRSERDAGLAGVIEPKKRDDSRTEGQAGTNNPHNRGARAVLNHHPTVKPLDLMRWLVRLVTPEGGTVLDPFCGSGTTGCAAVMEKRGFVGIDLEEDYIRISEARIAHWATQSQPEQAGLFD